MFYELEGLNTGDLGEEFTTEVGTSDNHDGFSIDSIVGENSSILGLIAVLLGSLILINWKINGSKKRKERKQEYNKREKVHGKIVEDIAREQEKIVERVKEDREIINEKKDVIESIVTKANEEIEKIINEEDKTVKKTARRIQEKWKNL